MQNLAGVVVDRANAVVESELFGAEVPMVDMPASGEVKATKAGLLEVGGYAITFRRFWVYWVAEVTVSPGEGRALMPRELARKLNDAPGTGEVVRYGGSGRNLGAVVRADGFAGGLPSDQLRDGVHSWHIDTQAGLSLFARWLRENLKAPEATESEQEQGARLAELRAAVGYAITCLTKVGLEPDAEGSPYARALAALQSAQDSTAPGEALPGVDALCEVMHDAYEQAATANGWETQARSRKPWTDVPEANKATMRVAVLALLRALGLTK